MKKLKLMHEMLLKAGVEMPWPAGWDEAPDNESAITTRIDVWNWKEIRDNALARSRHTDRPRVAVLVWLSGRCRTFDGQRRGISTRNINRGNRIARNRPFCGPAMSYQFRLVVSGGPTGDISSDWVYDEDRISPGSGDPELTLTMVHRDFEKLTAGVVPRPLHTCKV